MDASYQRRLTVRCPRCGVDCQIGLWTVLEPENHPELTAPFAASHFQYLECEHCGSSIKLLSPLVVYRRHDPQRVIIGEPRGAAKCAPGDPLIAALVEFRHLLGGDWEDSLLDAAMVVPAAWIPTIIKPQPEVVRAVLATGVPIARWIEANGGSWEDFRRLVAALAFLGGDSRQALHVMSSSPVLSEPATLTQLKALAAAHEAAGSTATTAVIQRRLAVLTRAAESSPRQAMAEFEAWRAPIMVGNFTDAFVALFHQIRTQDWSGALYSGTRLLDEVGDSTQHLRATIQVWMVKAMTGAELLRRPAALEDAAERLRQAIRLFDALELHYEAFEARCELALMLADHAASEEHQEEAIARYEEALRLELYRSAPTLWARSATDLGTVYGQRRRGDPIENQRIALRWHASALAYVSRSLDAEFWCDVRYNQGSSERMLWVLTGDLVSLDAARATYEDVLPVREALGDDQKLARVCCNLGDVLTSLPSDNRDETLRRAIGLFERCLTLTNPSSDLVAQQLYHSNLGVTWTLRTSGSLAENQERALHHLRLAVAGPDAGTRARADKNLCRLYAARVQGTRQDNFQRAVEHARRALETIIDSDAPWDAIRNNLAGLTEVDILDTMNIMAGALGELALGQGEPPAEAIAVLRLALSRQSTDRRPSLKALMLDTLLALLRNHPADSESLAEALGLAEEWLRTEPPESIPDAWAALASQVGLTRVRHPQAPVRVEFERAIVLYQKALLYLPPDHEQAERLRQNLSFMYHARPTGDRIGNALRSLELLETNLEYQRIRGDWSHYGETLGNIATCLRELPDDASAKAAGFTRLEEGHALIDAGLHPELWALLGRNLAEAYTGRSDLSPADLERAIVLARSALEILDRLKQRNEAARARLVLARLLSHIGEDEEAERLRSLGELELVLGPDKRLALQWRLQDEEPVGGSELLAEAIAHGLYREVWRAAGRWGDAAFSKRNWAAAVSLLSTWLMARERLLFESDLPDSRQNALAQQSDLLAALAIALVESGRPTDAVVAIERGRAVELEVWTRRASALRVDGIDADLRHRFEEAISDLRRLESLVLASSGWNWQTDEGHWMARTLAEAQEKLRSLDAELTRASQLEMGTLPADLVVLYCASLAEGSVCLIRRRGPEGDVVEVCRGRATLDDLLLALQRAHITRTGSSTIDWEVVGTRVRMSHFVEQELDTLLPLLGTTWLVDVAARIAVVPPSRVVVVPVGNVAAMPVHAATDSAAAASLVFEGIPLGYAPSAGIWLHCAAAAAVATARGEGEWIALGDPTDNSLPFARAELALLSRRGASTPGDLDNGLAALADARYIHFACHADFEAHRPWASSLRLAGGRRLTLANIHEHADLRARLAFLNACHTGTSVEGVIHDESVSIATGLIAAGVPAVVASLWAVEDLAAFLFSMRFWEEIGEHGRPAIALDRTRRWLRDVSAAQLLSVLSDQTALLATERESRPLRRASRLFAAQNPASRPYRDRPRCWSAFVLIGE